MAIPTPFRPGSIDLRTITLFDYTGRYSKDITSLVVEFNIYEDLFGNFTTADFTIIDGVGLIETFPIIGEERIYIEFATQGFKKFYKGIFDVYKIGDRLKLEQRADTYSLHCCSAELILDLNASVVGGYHGLRGDQIVRQVYDNFLKFSKFDERVVPAFIEKPLNTFGTIGLQSLVSPNISPTKFISLVANESVTNVTWTNGEQVPSMSYMFFENQKGFNFMPVDLLMTGYLGAGEKYYYGESSLEQIEKKAHTKDDQVTESQMIVGLRYKNIFDVIKGNMDGMYDNIVYTIDPLTKRFTTSTFNYDSQFDTMVHLGKYKMASDVSPRRNNPGEAHKRMIVSNVGKEPYGQSSYMANRVFLANGRITDPQVAYSRVRHKYLGRFTSAVAQLETIVVDISIFGNSERTVGELIELFVPLNSSTDDELDKYNPMFTNTENSYFLVTAVNHHYKKETNTYLTHMELVKDSFARKFKSEGETRSNG